MPCKRSLASSFPANIFIMFINSCSVVGPSCKSYTAFSVWKYCLQASDPSPRYSASLPASRFKSSLLMTLSLSTSSAAKRSFIFWIHAGLSVKDKSCCRRNGRRAVEVTGGNLHVLQRAARKTPASSDIVNFQQRTGAASQCGGKQLLCVAVHASTFVNI